MRLSGPHIPILIRRLGRKQLSPDPFWKKMARVQRPDKTSEICLAPCHDLTFPSHVQNLIEKICCHTHSEKNKRRRRSLSEHVHYPSTWQGPHFSMLSPKLGREFLPPHPISEKNEHLIRRSSWKVEFACPMTRTSLSCVVSKSCPK